MPEISNKIFSAIKGEKFTNPFSNEFDAEALNNLIGENPSDQEKELLGFLVTCNLFYVEYQANILSELEKITLSNDDLIAFFFVQVNRQFFKVASKFIEAIKGDIVHELGKTNYTKVENAQGGEIDAKFASEVGADIIAELISFVRNSRPDKKDTLGLRALNENEAFTPFHKAWICANIILNLKNAYEIVVYENGKIIMGDEQIKIKSRLRTVNLLKHVADFRVSNHIQEMSMPLVKYFELEKKKEATVIVINSPISNTIVLSAGSSQKDFDARAVAESALIVYYPHFIGEKLEHFGGLTLSDLIELYVLVEEAISIVREQIQDVDSLTLHQIPIRIKEDNLIQSLKDCSRFSLESIERFIHSLYADTRLPYFWRSPFYKQGEYLYFPIIALGSPNYSLYLEKWTAMSGYSLSNKGVRLKETILEDIKNWNVPYKFVVVDIKEKGVDLSRFINNIVIQTSNLLLLIEVTCFEFPLEFFESDQALTRLGNTANSINEKAHDLLKIYGESLSIEKIVITNHTTFSGLSINGVSILDYTLFQNYVTVGQHRRARITFSEGQPSSSQINSISYYKNEDEFNKNFHAFLERPLPVMQVLERFYIKEQQITPPFVSPKFIIDIIDHVSSEEMIKVQIDNLSDLLNHEYFGDPDEKIRELLDKSIFFNLTEVFHKLAYAPYESYRNRIAIYHTINKTKLWGFVHLSFYILNGLEQLNEKKIEKIEHFKTVEYEPEEVHKLLNRIRHKFTEKTRLSEFRIEEGIFNEAESNQIISYALDLVLGLTPGNFKAELDVFYFPITLLHGFSFTHNIDHEFYSACSNLVDAFNYTHKYQKARDFCEEVLVASINRQKHYQGWHILFKCHSQQRSLFDAAINGALFISSISVLPEIPYDVAVDALYESLKFFRNFGYSEYARFAYKNLQGFDLREYDKQKITLSYFNSFLQGVLQKEPDALDEILNYLNEKCESILTYGSFGIVPWLSLLYNIRKLNEGGQIGYDAAIDEHIKRLENGLNERALADLRNRILGNVLQSKQLYKSAIQNIYETRSVSDFVYEAKHLELLVSTLVQLSLSSNDNEGLLLAGLILNDQSFTFKEQYIPAGTLRPIETSENEELREKLDNYENFLLDRIRLKSHQLFVWVFSNVGKVYSLTIDHNKKIVVHKHDVWDLDRMREWLNGLTNFFFNSGKKKYYDLGAQEDDYVTVLKELAFTDLELDNNFQELLISTNIDLSVFPHNLIENQEEYLASTKSVCSVISIERFIDHCEDCYLEHNYSVSAWIPIEDQDPTVNWGFELLSPILTDAQAKIYSARYPNEPILTDLNLFLAHGALDTMGFKAVYSNEQGGSAILYPNEVFGKGKIAILFICNSGSVKEELFANNIVSFSGELLKVGYEAVVAPFWKFDVTIAPIWLSSFFSFFNSGISINEAVFKANEKVSEYNETTSSCFYAPAGRFAMHLYGNPNLFVKQQL